MDQNQLQQQQQEQQLWVECDPVTLVSGVRTAYNEDPTSETTKAGVEEIFSRFDHLSRAALGGSASSIFQGISSGHSGQKSRQQ